MNIWRTAAADRKGIRRIRAVGHMAGTLHGMRILLQKICGKICGRRTDEGIRSRKSEAGNQTEETDTGGCMGAVKQQNRKKQQSIQNVQEKQNIHIIIVGAGASGLVAAIRAAEAGARVTVLEQKEKAGKKILATGNGHCNFTNDRMDASCYHGNEFAMHVIRRFDVKKTLAFFSELGIFPHERNGYYYPASEQASAVVSLLLQKASALGVEILTDTKVLEIRKIENNGKSSFRILANRAVRGGETEKNEKAGKSGKKSGKRSGACEIRYESRKLNADRVILACGGQASPALGSDGSGYELARSLGHRILLPLPALTGIQCEETWFKQLAGIRISARVTILADGKKLAEDTGELQLTDYGISGIPVFQVSRYAAGALAGGKKVQAELTFFPEIGEDELLAYLQTHTPEQYTGLYPSKLLAVLEQMAKGRPWTARQLCDLTRHLRCTCREMNGFDRAQVTCGGVSLKEVDPDTLESLCCPGLYFAGELLDVDGICGGYNLQWAWSSGWAAGHFAAGKQETT